MSFFRYTNDGIEVPLANGNMITIPCADSDINISEEMNRSGVWKSLEGTNGSNPGFNPADKTTKDTSG